MKHKLFIVNIVFIEILLIFVCFFTGKIYFDKLIDKKLDNSFNLYKVKNFNIFNLISNDIKYSDLQIKEHRATSNEIKEPYFMFFKPKQSNGKAVIICPGGGYNFVSSWYDEAKVFAENGYAAFLMLYELPSEQKPDAALKSLQSMVKIVRKYSNIWDVNPNKTGAYGISAGGHLVANASNCFDKDSKLNFAILLSPVITMEKDKTESDTMHNVTSGKPELIDKYSIEKHVSKNAPKTFLIATEDDSLVPIINSKLYLESMLLAGNDITYVFYPKGDHFFSFFDYDRYEFAEDCNNKVFEWLEEI